MELTSQPVAKNTILLSSALVLQKILSFCFFLFIARRLGSLGTGQYVAAFSFSTLFGVFLDLGFSSVVTRDTARAPAEGGTILKTALFTKLFLAWLVYPALLLFVFILNKLGVGHPPMMVVAIAGLIMIVDSLSLTGASLLRGWQNLSFESLAVVINKLSIIFFGVLLLWVWPNPVAVACSILAGSLISTAIIYGAIMKQAAAASPQPFSIHSSRQLMRKSFPFALAAIFATAYGQVDSVILSIVQGNEAVGLYSVAAKTMNAFAFLPAAFSAAIFPSMSADFAQTGARLEWLLEESLRYLLIIAAPLAVGSFLYADVFVRLIGPEYREAAAAVRILMPSLIFVFLSFPIGAILNSTNRQSWQTALIISSTVFNIGLNLYLIPRYSYIGASWAWLLTNVYMIVLGFYLIRLGYRFRLRGFYKSVMRVSLGAVALVGIFYILSDLTNFVVTIIISGLVYLAVLWFTKEINKTELQQLWQMFKSRQSVAVSNDVELP
jgi:O-antigen/teichoic acid export membrane protein